jgi:hypothetical protein
MWRSRRGAALGTPTVRASLGVAMHASGCLDGRREPSCCADDDDGISLVADTKITKKFDETSGPVAYVDVE